MSPYRVGVIGCGNRSRAHLQADQLIDGLQLAACCDPVVERRENLAEEFGVRAYADAQNLNSFDPEDGLFQTLAERVNPKIDA
jgi:predicted dehydrogenase